MILNEIYQFFVGNLSNMTAIVKYYLMLLENKYYLIIRLNVQKPRFLSRIGECAYFMRALFHYIKQPICLLSLYWQNNDKDS